MMEMDFWQNFKVEVHKFFCKNNFYDIYAEKNKNNFII